MGREGSPSEPPKMSEGEKRRVGRGAWDKIRGGGGGKP